MPSRRAFIAALPALAFGAPARADGPIWPSKLVAAARRQVGRTVLYDPAYVRLPYPGGDVPADRGACTDVVIRAYRVAFNVDLQKLVHEDMIRAFGAYPKTWGLKQPDSNIDHRRVPNLETFFHRSGAGLPLASELRAGDLVTQRLPGEHPHIVLLTGERSRLGQPLVIHNMGGGALLEPIPMLARNVGRFRFAPVGT